MRAPAFSTGLAREIDIAIAGEVDSNVPATGGTSVALHGIQIKLDSGKSELSVALGDKLAAFFQRRVGRELLFKPHQAEPGTE